jgi:hypothetical protein
MDQKRDQKIEVVVNGTRHQFSSAKELVINRDDLDSELAHQAANYAWFSVLYEHARAARVRLEASCERMAMRIDAEVRAVSGKTTEASVKARVGSDPRLNELEDKHAEAERQERLLASLVYAFAQRKDMLISLSRSRHVEMSMPSADEVERIKRLAFGRKS